MKKVFYIGLLFSLLLGETSMFAQSKKVSDSLIFNGQLSTWINYGFDNAMPLQLGGRYIPSLEYDLNLPKNRLIDFEFSANIFGNLDSHPFDSNAVDGRIKPYRAWARYSGSQFEFRLGLQKIDFGSASLLRPLQWFNEIDPRDPLRLTNGVYGALGRYYFLNNANIWVWVLYGNELTRGFDVLKTSKDKAEFGGRIQLPTPKGELAFSYHHRQANTQNALQSVIYKYVPEDRFSLDGKWDVKIGLWFEATHIQKHKDLGILTNQSMLNVGTDYTFGLGNGLNIVAEHLYAIYNNTSYTINLESNFTATNITYPLGLFDNISAMFFYNWEQKGTSVFINYSHQFQHITAYLMAYYNPKTQQGIQQNDLLNTTSGPGLRLMLVYNH